MTTKTTTSKHDKRAVVHIGGKQYLVTLHDELIVERLGEKSKSKIVLKEVLAVLDSTDKLVSLGQPYCKYKIEAEIIEHIKGKKLIIQKYKPKTRYRRKIGHRQKLTKIKIVSIA